MNSHDYAQNPQRISTFINSASGRIVKSNKVHACCHTEQLCNRIVRVVEFTGRIYLCKDYEGVKNRKDLKETLASMNNGTRHEYLFGRLCTSTI